MSHSSSIIPPAFGSLDSELRRLALYVAGRAPPPVQVVLARRLRARFGGGRNVGVDLVARVDELAAVLSVSRETVRQMVVAAPIILEGSPVALFERVRVTAEALQVPLPVVVKMLQSYPGLASKLGSRFAAALQATAYRVAADPRRYITAVVRRPIGIILSPGVAEAALRRLCDVLSWEEKKARVIISRRPDLLFKRHCDLTATIEALARLTQSPERAITMLRHAPYLITLDPGKFEARIVAFAATLDVDHQTALQAFKSYPNIIAQKPTTVRLRLLQVARAIRVPPDVFLSHILTHSPQVCVQTPALTVRRFDELRALFGVDAQRTRRIVLETPSLFLRNPMTLRDRLDGIRRLGRVCGHGGDALELVRKFPTALFYSDRHVRRRIWAARLQLIRGGIQTLLATPARIIDPLLAGHLDERCEQMTCQQARAARRTAWERLTLIDKQMQHDGTMDKAS